MKESVGTAIYIGLAVLAVLVVAFLFSLGKRGKIAGVVMLLLGAGWGVVAFVRTRPDSKRQLVAFSIMKQVSEEKTIGDLPPDQIEWLFSKAGWSPPDIARVDSLFSEERHDWKRVAELQVRLCATDPMDLDINEKVYGQKWREDAQDELALAKRMQEIRAGLARGTVSLEERGGLEKLAAIAREAEDQLAPLWRERFAITARRASSPTVPEK